MEKEIKKWPQLECSIEKQTNKQTKKKETVHLTLSKSLTMMLR